MTVATRLMTAEELERMPDEDARIELVRGELVKMAPAGFKHGRLAAIALLLIGNFVREKELGTVYAAETGFILTHNPDTVRAPDVAFVTAERVARQERQQGFFDGPPDLAVEVVSPDDTHADVEEKVLDYLQAGTRLVWVVHPRTQTVTVYRSLDNVRILTQEDTLTGDDVLPGFTVSVRELFT